MTHQSSQRTYPPSSTNDYHSGPFIGQSIVRPSCPSILKSTRRERMPLHSPVRAIYNSQTKKRTTKRHSFMCNPPFSKNVNPNIGHRFLTLDNKTSLKTTNLEKSSIATPSRSATAVWITLSRLSTITTNAFWIHPNSPMKLQVTQLATKNATAVKRSHAHSTETASSHPSVIYQAIVKRKDNNTSET